MAIGEGVAGALSNAKKLPGAAGVYVEGNGTGPGHHRTAMSPD